MPDMDGFQVAKALRGLEATQSVPIIMLSSRDETEYKVKGFSHSINDYVTKPFNFDELNARIQAHINLRKAEHALSERNKQAALIDLVDGLADTLLNRLNLALLQLQLITRRAEMGEEAPEEGTGDLGELRDFIWSSVEVVNELLRQTKLVTQPERRPVNLPHLLESLPEEFPDLKFRIRIEDGLPAAAGSERIQNVFHALCRNAREAMMSAAAPAIVEIKAARVEDGDAVRVSVRDRGCGIEKRDLPKIFTPFFTTKGTKSPGLGLWTVYQSMDILGGQVDVLSEPGKGAEFVLTFPVSPDGF